MKRCPECRRDYYDETLLYCLDDGNALLDGPRHSSEPPASAGGPFGDEPKTAILRSTDLPGEAAIRARTNTTDHTAILPGGTEAGPQSKLRGPSKKESIFAKTAAKPLAMLAAAVLVLVGGFFGYRYLSAMSSDQINSIAVLPFENRGGSSDTDYLSDGLTDSLIFRFSQLPNIKVSPTSSVMRYKGKTLDLSQIAKELAVDGVLSGRLTQIGDNLNISVQLIDVRTEKIVWAEQYDRKLADLLATQREIATTLTQKMKLGFAADEKGITKKYTNSSDAYQLYLKGRFHWGRRTKDDLDKSIDSFKQAIALDPAFALAYVGMAEAYNSMAKDPDAPPKDCLPFGKAAAIRALEIDPTLAEAHSALADPLALYEWNWAESEKEFKRAIEIDPNISYIHLAYSGSYLSAAGRADEAVREAQRAIELEPLSLINNSVLVSSYIYARQYEKALSQAHAAHDLDPDFPLARLWLGLAYITNEKYAEAISQSKEGASRPSPARWASLYVLAHAYAKAGQRAEAEKIIGELKAIAKSQYVRTYYLACVYAALGDKDKAIAELEKSFEDKDTCLSRARIDPFMDPLRDDPRFAGLLQRMNLPE